MVFLKMYCSQTISIHFGTKHKVVTFQFSWNFGAKFWYIRSYLIRYTLTWSLKIVGVAFGFSEIFFPVRMKQSWEKCWEHSTDCSLGHQSCLPMFPIQSCTRALSPKGNLRNCFTIYSLVFCISMMKLRLWHFQVMIQFNDDTHLWKEIPSARLSGP